MLKKLEIHGWKQFEKISIDFDKRVTLITGANGAGKSTIFRMIANDMGWSYTETSNPVKDKKNSSPFYTGISDNSQIKRNKNHLIHFTDEQRNELLNLGYLHRDIDEVNDPYDYLSKGYFEIGNLISEDGNFTYFVPEFVEDGAYYFHTKFEPSKFIDVKENQLSEISTDYLEAYISYIRQIGREIKGLSIPSHRSPYTYEKIDSIPIHAPQTTELIKDYFESVKNRTLNNTYANDHSPILTMKKSIVSLALFSEDNTYVKGNPEFKIMIDEFNEVLMNVLPKHLQFEGLLIVSGEVVMSTKAGDFLIDAASGGIGALIDIAWQIFVIDFEYENYVVVIDELENHLHPSMQREILPNLLNAFPKAQFIVSTHSPFIVNSIIEGKVYALTFNSQGKVNSELLNFDNKSADAFEILKDVLGVSVTMPIWMEKEFNNTINEISTTNPSELNVEDYEKMKLILEEKGLLTQFPQLLKMLMEKNND